MSSDMSLTTQTHTPWPVIWTRNLRSHNAVAQSNALAAWRVLQERRLEAEDAERFLASRQHDERRRA